MTTQVEVGKFYEIEIDDAPYGTIRGFFKCIDAEPEHFVPFDGSVCALYTFQLLSPYDFGYWDENNFFVTTLEDLASIRPLSYEEEKHARKAAVVYLVGEIETWAFDEEVYQTLYDWLGEKIKNG